jgi:CO/xanthine dehydrogenase FAD-binding subunit
MGLNFQGCWHEEIDMILEYYRPDNLEDSIELLSRTSPETIVLGGGLFINEVIKEPVAVVDIQDLGLDGIKSKGKQLDLGAGVTLQALLNHPACPFALKEAIKHQETYNRRQVATVAGSLVAATGRSSIPGVMLAVDAELEIVGKGNVSEILKLGDFLPLRKEKAAGRIITRVSLPAEIQVAYAYVARSPADFPIVAAAVARWTSGRTRVVLIGYGDQPIMVLDGPDSDGAEAAARDAYSDAGDQWAGAAYRSDIAGVLVKRCLDEIAGRKKD